MKSIFPTRQILSDDQLVAASGHGGYCPEGIPAEFALLSILAAFGVAFGVLYRALTLTTGMKRKRKRRDPGSEFDIFMFGDILGDLSWAGWAAEQLAINCWVKGYHFIIIIIV